MKKLILSGSLILLFQLLSAQNPEMKTGPTGRLTTPESLRIDGFSFTPALVKPVTVPLTPDPSSWKIIASTNEKTDLCGISGIQQNTSYSTGTGRLDCQRWTSANNDLMAFRQIFTNTSKKVVKLTNLFPLVIEGKDFSFGNTSDWRILEQFRHKNDLPVTEEPVAGKTITCDPFLIINNNKGNGSNLLIGYQTFDLHLAEIDVAFGKDLTTAGITAKCDFESVEVPPEGSRTSQWVIIAGGNDANVLISEYTGRVRTYYNMDKPAANAPSVYCTWYYHADNYNEEIFKNDIAQFRKEHLPFDVFLIDECWDMNDWGDFEAGKSFPDGMRWVASEINSAGYVAGIWTAPFLVDGESTLAKEHPAWLLKNSKGQLCTFNMNGRDHFIFDLTYPGVCTYLENQFRKISQDWGYKYFKFDFMRSVFIDSDQQFFDKTATSLGAYRMGLEAIRRGTGKDAYISVCGGHYGASYGIANTQRSGSDVKSEWNEKELPKYRQNILRTWMTDLWHVDPDAMMVRRQQTALESDKKSLTPGLFTDDEAFTNTVNQFIGGNLITFTEDFARIDNDRKMLYRHVVPSVNSSSQPVDIYNTNCPEIMVTHIVPACSNLDQWKMLSVVNWSNNSKDYQVILDNSVIKNLKGEKFLVYDFETMQVIDFLLKGETLKINNVRPHQSKMLKIVPWNGKSAMFVGTDLNFSCGGMEVKGISFENGIITGSLETGWHVPVRMAFVVPTGKSYELRKIEISAGQKNFYFRY